MNGRRLVGATVFTLLMVVLNPSVVTAQFGEGQRYIGAHVGLSGVGSAPAIGVNGEVAINENIGIGGWLDTWSFGESFTGLGGGSWNVRYFAVAGTGAWHFPIKSNPKLDPFAGVGVGYFVVSSSWDGNTTTVGFSGSGSRLFVDGFAGLRYRLKETLAGVVRAGASASYLTVGLDFLL